jgi:hypothetical protein
MRHKLFRENLQHYVWCLWAGGLTNSLPGATGTVPLQPALQAHQPTMSSNEQQKPQVDKCRSDEIVNQMTPFHVFVLKINYKSFSVWMVSEFLRGTIKSSYSKIRTIFPYNIIEIPRLGGIHSWISPPNIPRI